MEPGAILYNQIMSGYISQLEPHDLKVLRRFIRKWEGKMVASRVPGDWEIYNIKIVLPINVNLHDRRYVHVPI